MASKAVTWLSGTAVGVGARQVWSALAPALAPAELPAPAGAALTAGVLELLAPARCLGCDLRLRDLPVDPRDRPLLGGDDHLALEPGPPIDGFCGACAPLLEPRALRGDAAGLFDYGGPIADAIVRMKHGGRAEIAAHLGRLLAAGAAPWARRVGVDVVVPAPSHPRRLAQRGFEPTTLLARPLAAALGVPLAVGALVRRRPTALQRGLGAKARAANVRGAFEGRPGRLPPGAETLLLVDDVRSSGATLAEAARALSPGDPGSGFRVRTLVVAVRL
jgi:predicted amidophosphoribosyltransferase